MRRCRIDRLPTGTGTPAGTPSVAEDGGIEPPTLRWQRFRGASCAMHAILHVLASRVGFEPLSQPGYVTSRPTYHHVDGT